MKPVIIITAVVVVASVGGLAAVLALVKQRETERRESAQDAIEKIGQVLVPDTETRLRFGRKSKDSTEQEQPPQAAVEQRKTEKANEQPATPALIPDTKTRLRFGKKPKTEPATGTNNTTE